jgi:hypothetical protein
VEAKTALKQIIERFLLPWSAMREHRINPILRSVLVGCLSTFVVLAFGWQLFSNSESLRNRSVISVLVSPDYRFIEAKSEVWVKIGGCVETGYSPPIENNLDLIAPGTVCRGWTRGGSQTLSSMSVWYATKYRYEPEQRSYSFGNSRWDALSHLFSSALSLAKSLLIPLGVLSTIQLGVAVGYRSYQKAADSTKASD